MGAERRLSHYFSGISIFLASALINSRTLAGSCKFVTQFKIDVGSIFAWKFPNCDPANHLQLPVPLIVKLWPSDNVTEFQ